MHDTFLQFNVSSVSIARIYLPQINLFVNVITISSRNLIFIGSIMSTDSSLPTSAYMFYFEGITIKVDCD